MALTIYKPALEVCFECGYYFPKRRVYKYAYPILGYVKLCKECFGKKSKE